MGKRKRSTGQVRANERDYRILEDAGRLGAVTIPMMHQKYWQGRKEQTCEDRLDQLVRAKLLQSEIIEVNGKIHKIYYLAKKGSGMFDKETQQHFYRSKPTEIEMSHVLEVGKYLISRQSKVKNFVNERELRSINLKLPQEEQDEEATDGYIEEIGDDGGVAGYFLEIDSNACGVALSSKCSGLNAKVQKSGKSMKYVVYSKSRLKLVRSAFHSVGGAPNIQFVLMS